MTDIETAWVAGLLEGEGSFMLRRSSRKCERLMISVACAMTDEDSVRKLCATVGSGHITYVVPKQENHKPQWCWRLERRLKVVELITCIRKYMSLRRGNKIDEMLKFNDEFPLINGNPNPSHGTRIRYDRFKCRCDECRAFVAERSREYYAKSHFQQVLEKEKSSE